MNINILSIVYAAITTAST